MSHPNDAWPHDPYRPPKKGCCHRCGYKFTLEDLSQDIPLNDISCPECGYCPSCKPSYTPPLPER